jgi:hypothetical protein
MLKKSLALFCLLFAPALLHAQTSAQSHYPDALETDHRPAVLKLLKSDAETKFVKSGIPLLKTTQELQNAPGSPELFITVTLDKPNGHVFPVVSETRLLQKARLSHVPSMELVVSTWVTNSIGNYEITDLESMRLQVGNEIDQFIKAYFAANPK